MIWMVMRDERRSHFIASLICKIHQARDIPSRVYHCHFHRAAGSNQIGKVLHRTDLNLL